MGVESLYKSLEAWLAIEPFSPEEILARFPKVGTLVEHQYTGDLGVVTAIEPYWQSRPGSGSIGLITVAWLNFDGYEPTSTGSVELYQRALGRCVR